MSLWVCWGEKKPNKTPKKYPTKTQSLCYIQIIFKSMNTLVWYAMILLFLSDIHAKNLIRYDTSQNWDKDKNLSLSTELMPSWWQRAPEALCRTQEWTKRWQMSFSVDICKLIHLMENNLSHIHTMLTNDWRKKSSSHYRQIPRIKSFMYNSKKNPSRTLVIMRKGIKKKTKHIYTLVHPHLKYFWSLHLKNRL